MAVQGDLNRSELSCDVITEIDSERGRMPTREDVRALLEKYQDNLFYFNFCFNTPPPPAVPGPTASPRTNPIETGRPKRPSPKSKKIVNFLWEKYRLYKLKSTRGQPHTLSRSMYLGLLRDGDLNRKKEKIYDLIDEAKRELLGKGEELNIAKVHVIPTQAIIYDREREEEEEGHQEEEEEGHQEEEEGHQEEEEGHQGEEEGHQGEEEGHQGEEEGHQGEEEEDGEQQEEEEEEQEQQEKEKSVITISSGEEEEMEEEVIYISSEDERDEDDQTQHSLVIPDEVQEERESKSWIDKDLLESLKTLQMELLS